MEIVAWPLPMAGQLNGKNHLQLSQFGKGLLSMPGKMANAFL